MNTHRLLFISRYSWLLIVIIWAVGILLPSLDLQFFFDDWPLLYVSETGTSEQIKHYHAADRIIGYYLHYPFDRLLEANPLGWHLFHSLAVLACSLALFRFLQVLLGPDNGVYLIASLLFLVNPLFTEHSIAPIYSFLYFTLFFYLISLILTLAYQRTRKIGYALLAIVLGAGTISVAEYYVGFELLRLAILLFPTLFIAGTSTRQAFRLRSQQIKDFLLFLAIPVLFACIRLFSNQFITREKNDVRSVLEGIQTSPVNYLVEMLKKVMSDTVGIYVSGWFRPFNEYYFSNFSLTETFLWVAGAIVLFILVLWLLRKSGKQEVHHNISRKAFFLFLLLPIAVTVPFWLMGFRVYPGEASRFAFPASISLCTAFSFLMYKILQKSVWKKAVLAFILTFYVLFQGHIYGKYRRQQNFQNDLVTQIKWRVPALAKPAYFLYLFEELPMLNDEDYIYSAMLNYSYPPPNNQLFSHWLVLHSRSGIDSSNIKPLSRKLYRSDMRGLPIHADIENSLLLEYNGKSCVHLYDAGNWFFTNHYFTFSGVGKAAGKDPSAFVLEQESPSRLPVSTRKDETCWCYYFQKASLALQTGQLGAVMRLYDQAIEKELGPLDEKEWFPFLQASVQLGQSAKTSEILDKIKTPATRTLAEQLPYPPIN